jgi:DNA repair protein SbcC/Rad50
VKLLSVATKGLTVLPNEVSVDFEALGPGLIAIHGENGAGKTTFMEAPAAALYKAFPSRPGSLYDYARSRDAYIVAQFQDDQGRVVEAKLLIDGVNRKLEPYLTVDGVPVTTGRSKEYEAEVEKRFGSWSLLLTSIFSAQNRAGNFLDAPKAARKELFIEMLGLRRLNDLQVLARENGAETLGKLHAARAAAEAFEAAEALLKTHEEALAGIQETIDAHKTAGAEALAQQLCFEALAEQLREEKAARAQQEAKVREQQQVFQRALEAYGRATEDLQSAGENAAGKIRFLGIRNFDAEITAAHTRSSRGLETLEKSRVEHVKLVARKGEAETAGGKLAELREALGMGRDLHAALVMTGKALSREQAAFREAHDRAEREQAKLDETSSLIGKVPCSSEDGWIPAYGGDVAALSSTCPLLAAANAAKCQTVTMPDRTALTAAEEAHHAAEAHMTAWRGAWDSSAVLEGRIAEAQKLADLRSSIDLAEKSLAGVEEEQARLARELKEEMDALHADRAARDADVENVKAELAQVQKRLGAAADEKKATADAEAATLEALQASLPPVDPNAPDLDATLKEAGSWKGVAGIEDDRVREAERNALRVTFNLEQNRLKMEETAAAASTKLDLEADVADWTYLTTFLGKDGVQALEIAAAGPEVARITNDLLLHCYGPRFQLSFDTLREKKSAPGEFSEAFDVRVYDNGDPRVVEALSGGEKVIVGEAIGLAIAIFNAQKNGVRWRTLWRDETSGALSATNAQAYVDLLRRAMALGGFHQVVFIAHQREVVERADVRLLVRDGQVTVS